MRTIHRSLWKVFRVNIMVLRVCAACTQQYYYDDDDDNIYVYDYVCVCVSVYCTWFSYRSYFPYVWEMMPRRRNTQQATKKEKQFQALIFFGGIRLLCVFAFGLTFTILWLVFCENLGRLSFYDIFLFSAVFYSFYTKSHINDEEIKRFRMNYVSKDSCPP